MNVKKRIPLIEVKGVCKNFRHIEALKNLDFAIYKNESVGLVGDNGAGKSTLIKILSGLFPPTKGKIFIEGKEVKLNSYSDSTKYGIETIYQDSAVVNDMDIARNIFLGREPVSGFGFLNLKKMDKLSMEILDSIGIRGIDSSRRLVDELSGGQKQSVAIARAVHFKSKVLLLDEPTSALSVKETRFVHDFIIKLKKEGISSVYVSHTISNVYDVVDRFVILRRGENAGEFLKEETSVEEISEILCSHGSDDED
jgi:simple sugar transport system ATP-binding protein